MSGNDWKLTGASPFLTDRARTRAPLVLSYAGVTGGALLVSPSGDVVLASGAADEADADRIVRAATALGAAGELRSFRMGKTCVHAGPVSRGWMLCILSTGGVHPSAVIERLRRASHVLALALVDVVPSNTGESGSGGAPATAFNAAVPARRN